MNLNMLQKSIYVVSYPKLKFFTQASLQASDCKADRNSHLMLLIYKALLLKLPNKLTFILTFKCRNYSTQSSNYLTLNIPHLHTNVSRTIYKPWRF